MRLNHEVLMKLAKEKAKKRAASMYPEGKKRQEMERELTHKIYAEYVTPPRKN